MKVEGVYAMPSQISWLGIIEWVRGKDGGPLVKGLECHTKVWNFIGKEAISEFYVKVT